MENESQGSQESNFALIETHVQVSNLVKILFTINPNILAALVDQTPEEMRATSHYKVLSSTFQYYKEVYDATAKKEEAPSNIIPSTILPAQG
jgi:hypothetical protein